MKYPAGEEGEREGKRKKRERDRAAFYVKNAGASSGRDIRSDVTTLPLQMTDRRLAGETNDVIAACDELETLRRQVRGRRSLMRGNTVEGEGEEVVVVGEAEKRTLLKRNRNRDTISITSSEIGRYHPKKNIIVFFAQAVTCWVIIAASLFNLSRGNDPKLLWVSLLTLAAGVLLPNPGIKQLNDPGAAAAAAAAATTGAAGSDQGLWPVPQPRTPLVTSS